MRKVVLKPRRGQASVLVGVAQSEAQASRMYDILCASRVSIDSSEVNPPDDLSSLSALDCAAAMDTSGADAPGATAGNVLMQEFVEGDEWVVDMVSRNGEHKALALWKYDKHGEPKRS